MKTNIELLMESPEAMQRFQHALERAATVIGIDKEINKLSDSLRTQLTAAQACSLNTDNLLHYCREKRHERLLVFATSVGTERGKRLGRERAQELILEAHSFGALQAEKYAFLKSGARLNEGD